MNAIDLERGFINWDHDLGNREGVCKLIRLAREEIDGEPDEDAPEAWELLWIERSTGLRRVELRLDPACGRLSGTKLAEAKGFLSDAPEEAREVLAEIESAIC